jgi:integrase
MRKQPNPFKVRTVVLDSGERLPMLCARASGLPLLEPTLYVLTELRAKNRSTSTIQQALRSVMLLFIVLDRLGVDLDGRLSEGRLLELGEVEEVVRQCRTALDGAVGLSVLQVAPTRPSVANLERVRTRSSAIDVPVQVDPGTAAIRIRYLRDYLNWRTTDLLLKMGRKDDRYSGLATAADVVRRAFDERIPGTAGHNTLTQREGMSHDALTRLIEVIEPTSPDNPWAGTHARERNALIVRWLLSLGLRRGELLGVRTSDINFQTNEVLIARRADDPADPRKLQPNTKTNDRLLALDEDLAVLTRRYITGHRRAIKGARRHEYLIVANGSGAPLTLAALNKVFVALRRNCRDLPEELSPHVLRHTWNDNFSEVMDKQQVSEETERKMRSRLMGWSETSNTAATYTRRHVQRKARDASLELQRKLRAGDPR